MQTGLRRGEGDGCEAGRRAVHPPVMVCKRCGGLVAWARAKQRAEAAKRTQLRDGDGCSSAKCTRAKAKRARTPTRAKMQVSMARGLLDGSRVLVEWPTSYADKAVWQRPAATAAAVARATLEKYGEGD